MSLSKTTFHRFKQNDYVGTFYECDNDHPFIAFTTCYCPLCDMKCELANAQVELEQVETSLDNCMESYEDLVVKVTRYNPELLI